MLQQKAHKSNLMNNIISSAADIIIPDEAILSPSLKENYFEFNAENNLPVLEKIIEDIAEDTDVCEAFSKHIERYYNSIVLHNNVNKLIVLNTLKNIEREIIRNQERSDAYSQNIYFKDFLYINFDNGKPYPRTTAFVDLIHKKALNRRTENKIPASTEDNRPATGASGAAGATGIRSRVLRSAYYLDREPNFFNPEGYSIIGRAFEHSPNTKQAHFEIEFGEPVLINRFFVSFEMHENIHCSVFIYAKDFNINILNEELDKQKYDRVFEMMEATKIVFIVSSTLNEIDLKITRFELYNDIYHTESVLCTVPIYTGNMPFQIDINHKEYPGTKIYPLAGMIKDGIITWKAVRDEMIYGYEADYIVVYIKLSGTERNTPIIFDIAINKKIGF